MKTYKKGAQFQKFMLWSLSFAFLITIYSVKRAYNPIEARAARIYAYDSSHPNKIPNQKIRALSIAVAFEDESGAEAILDQIESSL